MRRWIVALALLVVGCGGNDSPLAPSFPAAVLQSQGRLTPTDCSFGACSYQGEARNVGAGCAINVRGVTRVYDTTNTQRAIDDWSLLSSRRIRPQETFIYGDSYAFSLAVLNLPNWTYRTEISWDNAAC